MQTRCRSPHPRQRVGTLPAAMIPEDFNVSTGVQLALGAIALGAVVKVGWLRPGTLRKGPNRATGLKPVDLLVAFALLLAGGILAGSAQRMFVGTSPADVNGLSTLGRAGLTLLIQILGQGPLVVYVVVRAMGVPRGLREVGLRPRRPVWELGAAGLALLVGLPMLMGVGIVVALVSHWLHLTTPKMAHDLLPVLKQADSKLGLAALAATVVIVAPLLEETIFRGLVQSAILSWVGPSRRWTVVLVAAALFTSMHVGAGTFDAAKAGGVYWTALPTLFVLAMILGWLYERTGSLWPSMIVHGTFNLLNVLVVLYLL